MSVNIERNKEIYHKRVIEKRTLKSVGDEYGLSTESIRRIVARLDRAKLLREKYRSRLLNPKVMKDIWWSRRIYNCLYSENLLHVSIKDFAENADFYKTLQRTPNMGKKGIEEIYSALKGKEGK